MIKDTLSVACYLGGRPTGCDSPWSIAVEQSDPGAGGERGSPSPPLPLVRAQAGTGVGENAAQLGSASRSRACEARAGTRSLGLQWGWRGLLDRRETRGHGESSAALCHGVWRGIRPACLGLLMSDKLALSDISKFIGRRPIAFDRLSAQAVPLLKGRGLPEALLTQLAIFLHCPVGLPTGLTA